MVERDHIDPRIEYDGFQEPCPSEAWGRFLGGEWWLYARGDGWDFTLATDPAINIFALDLRGHPSDQIPPGVFFQEVRYPRPGAAGYMTNAEKREAIRSCIAAFERGVDPSGE